MKRAISLLLSIVMITSVLVLSGTVTAGLAGDCNGDGNVDNKDVVVLFRFVSGNKAGAVEDNCDYNGDGEINNKDVVFLFRYVSGGVKEEDESVYDFNGDKEVNNKDVVELFRFASTR